MERPYLEVKVSFIHIIILLAGVILIGTFLFYLGFQAGKSSYKTELLQAQKQNPENTGETLQLGDANMSTTSTNATNANTTKPVTANQQPSIDDELKLHQLPTTDSTTEKTTTTTTTPQEEPQATKPTPPPTTDDKVTIKPLEKESYYAIQVGAFVDYENAKQYSTKFANLGYPTEILSPTNNSKPMYRVRVGNFSTRKEAETELTKLEKMESRKFSIVKQN